MTDSPHDAFFKAAFETPDHATAVFRGVLPAPVVEAIHWHSVAAVRDPSSTPSWPIVTPICSSRRLCTNARCCCTCCSSTRVRAIAACRCACSHVAQLLRYVQLVLGSLDLARFRAKLRETLTDAEAVMTLEELVQKKVRAEGRSEGRAEGRSEGRAEGRSEGRAELLLEQLDAKFGHVSPQHHQRIADASIEELRRFAMRVLVVDAIDDVFA